MQEGKGCRSGTLFGVTTCEGTCVLGREGEAQSHLPVVHPQMDGKEVDVGMVWHIILHSKEFPTRCQAFSYLPAPAACFARVSSQACSISSLQTQDSTVPSCVDGECLQASEDHLINQ